MPTDTSEKELERILTTYLCDKQGYEQGASYDYNKEYGIDTGRLKRFILATQKDKVQNTQCFANGVSERKFFSKLSRDLSKYGVTYMLRKGFKYIETFDLYYPLPSELNPTAQKMYNENIFCVTRQLYYSTQCTDSIDVYITLNGLPIMTMELKNHYTGQTIDNAIKQYRDDRNPKADPTALILQKRRCAVHFAVDDDSVMMCTELKGKQSWFLPFNKGVNGGAGNPNHPDGMRTAYMWEEVLGKQSLSDILENYAQIIHKEKTVKNKKTGKKETKTVEINIWPRYHQLDCVRKLLQATKEGGVGQRFLVQHSAGSGKSNSITWLAYQLVGLLDGTRALLDSVIVVTDRVNLDTQIRDNINAFKKLQNIVGWADSSKTLQDALKDGKKIIITTIHKFSYILETIGTELRGKRFGIIIDEAHSSQNGSMSAKENLVLSGTVTNKEEDLEDKLNKIIEGRKMVKNANYYAFTATPKEKTLNMFGIPQEQPDGKVRRYPFHEYTMKQAIEEGFIMDVLQNYTTYTSFYKVVKTIASDPEFDEKKAQKKIRAYVEGRPETIRQKAEIIVNHFLTSVIERGKIGGEARAMVVTSSIIRAIDFYYDINRLFEERKSPYRAIVAFSGSKEYNGKTVTEADVNGFPSKDIEDKMEEDPYRILVVANKFQTGYDQPLLHSMYVDKQLSDVAAVQTLSRLNRCHPLKRDTFVLDFCNDIDTIKQSFQRFYKTTILSDEVDPNKLNDLLDIIEPCNIYTEAEVKELNEKYWAGEERSLLDPIVNKAVDRFKTLEEGTQIKCKSSMKAFVRNYPFIAAVTPYKNVEWEMLNTYFMLLVRKLPKLKDEDFTEGLEECIDLDQIQTVKVAEHNAELENKDTEIDPIPVGAGKGDKQTPEMARLSDILDQFNEINWQNIETVKEQIDSLPGRLQADENFVNAVKNSNHETAQKQGFASMMNIVIQMMSESTEFCRQYLDNRNFQNAINDRVFNKVYRDIMKTK